MTVIPRHLGAARPFSTYWGKQLFCKWSLWESVRTPQQMQPNSNCTRTSFFLTHKDCSVCANLSLNCCHYCIYINSCSAQCITIVTHTWRSEPWWTQLFPFLPWTIWNDAERCYCATQSSQKYVLLLALNVFLLCPDYCTIGIFWNCLHPNLHICTVHVLFTVAHRPPFLLSSTLLLYSPLSFWT